MTLETAFSRFFLRVRSWARGTGAPECDVDDIVQDVFQAFCRNESEIPDGAVQAWLRVVTARIARRHVAKTYGRRDDAPYDEADHEAALALPEHALGGCEAEAVILGLVAQLEPRRREVFVRHVLAEEPMEQITASQGIPLATGHTRLRLAREDLKEAIERFRAQERRTARGSTSFTALPVLSSLFSRRRFWTVAGPAFGVAGAIIALALLLGETPALAPVVVEAPARPVELLLFSPAVSFAEAPHELEAAMPGAGTASLPAPGTGAASLPAPGAEAPPVRGAASPGAASLPAPGAAAPPAPGAGAEELPEHVLVTLARRALTEGSPARARGFLDRADRAYPAGRLLPERAQLRARAAP